MSLPNYIGCLMELDESGAGTALKLCVISSLCISICIHDSRATVVQYFWFHQQGRLSQLYANFTIASQLKVLEVERSRNYAITKWDY
jgi:hypothetical protein